jgi:hypothetical protein
MDQWAFRNGKSRVMLGENLSEVLHRGEELPCVKPLVTNHQDGVLDERAAEPLAYRRLERLT